MQEGAVFLVMVVNILRHTMAIHPTCNSPPVLSYLRVFRLVLVYFPEFLEKIVHFLLSGIVGIIVSDEAIILSEPRVNHEIISTHTLRMLLISRTSLSEGGKCEENY